MKLRSIAIAIALTVVGSGAGAQDVRVEVFEAATGRPIVGANVSLYDSAGNLIETHEQAGGFKEW